MCQRGGRALFKRLVAEGKKLFKWRAFLVPTERSLLPEGKRVNSLCPGWEGSATIFPARLLEGPGGVQVVEGWQVAADHLLCRADDTLQPGLILGCGCSVPDGDGGGEDGLNDGGVEVHHHLLWQVEFFQLP